jgi:hypothetical protein
MTLRIFSSNQHDSPLDGGAWFATLHLGEQGPKGR